MKSKWSGRFSKGSLFLIGGFLILFSPCAGKAQNNSTVNLAGTVWNRTPQIVEFPSDGTFATIKRGYTFGLQGNVKEALAVNKPAGVMLAYEYDSYNRENRLTTRPTMPINTFETLDGTYEINGRYIYMNFPGYTISATLDSGSMRGELTYKKDNKKEEWIVRRQSNPSNEPIDGGKFSAPADSPMIGTWKYVQYSDKGEIIQTLTQTYSPNGVVESIHQLASDTRKTKGNWKYTPKTSDSGVLEEFQGDDLVERGNVKFYRSKILGVSLEYTITFSQDSNFVGHKSKWEKQ